MRLMDTFTVGDLEAFLDERYRAFVRKHPDAGPRPNLPPAFSDWEANWFLQGIRSDLFQIGDDGRLASAMTTVRGGFFGWSERQNKAGASREGITHCAAAAELVVRYGWPSEQVVIESRRYRGAPRWALDLVVWEQQDACVIAGEVKISEAKLSRLITDIEECNTQGPHDVCGRDGHPTYVGVRAFEPRFFWAVSPTKQMAFRVNRSPERFSLQPAKELPRPASLA